MNLRRLYSFLPVLGMALVFVSLSATAQFDAASPESKLSAQFGTSGDIEQTSFLKVHEAYQPLVEIENGAIHVKWSIADEYYLYRDNFKFKLMDARGRPLPLDVELSEGKEKEDEFFGRVKVHYFNARQILTPLPAGPATLTVVSQGCADAGLCYPPWTLHYRVDPQSGAITKIELPRVTAAKGAAAAPQPVGNLWLMVLYALLGGAILNLMPCVFPVLGLKVMSFARSEAASAPVHGLSYTAGVVLSFVAVAALLISLKASGQALGWGFQLQHPPFVAFLSVLFFVLAMAMWGWLEIAGRWMGFGGEASHRDSLGGSFFTGVLAAVVASPCTAPFMGVALGFALTQSAVTALLVFAALGLGMALPLLLLTLAPGWLEKMPRPGAWMLVFRQALAFPLFATALWLAWVLGQQAGATAMALVALLMLLAVFIAWALRFGSTAGKIAAVVAVLSALALLWGQHDQFATRSAVTVDDHTWSESRVAQLREAGTPVFVDVTADWCITCRANEALVLNTAATRAAFDEAGIVVLVADWTNYDPAITTLVERYGRGGIPLYLMYPADAARDAIVLPQILTDAAIRRAIESIVAR